MSDSKHSTVTYTLVSILVEDDSDIGSPGIDGPPIMPEDPYAYIMAAYQVPPSPDYIPGPEVPPSPDYIPGPEEPQSPPPLDFVPEPMYHSPGYVLEFDPEEEPEEDDEDPEEDPADYPADRDDDDDEDEDEDEDEEEEEEHVALADSVLPVHRMTARISIWDEPSISLPPREEVERLLALTTLPPSPLTPLSSPLPQIPSPPPNSPTHIEIPESCLPLRKRVRFASPTPSYEVGESSVAGAARQDGPAVAREDPYFIARGDLYGFIDMVDVAPGHPMSRELDYGITDTWDDLVGAIDEIAPTTLEGVNQRVTDLSTIVEQETTIMYGIMEDARDDREREAKMAHKAWGLSVDASDYARSDVMSLRTTVVAQSTLISELQLADHRRQRVISELLASDHKRQVQLTKTLSLLSIIGYSQLVDYIDLLFCLATQYRSFVQKMAPKRRTTRLNPSATPTPVIDTHTTTSVTNAQIQVMINEGITAALAAHDATRNGDDSHTSGTGGTKEVVGLTQWFEKIESVYSISNCTVACQVKFATCTLQGNALTWWNSHVKTTTPEAAHAMPWRTLKKMMTDKYCPRV
ncbi:hypothetical protein Tco_0975343 [Tanacetum coccineum]|uniref:Reverse transcriptase domain-containing protein n=1 Tax=Tanacetum coccineum TaxID=301880 RepID=A0ABQ5EE51_9ASTR